MVVASFELNGRQYTDVEVINPGDWAGLWLIEIGYGSVPFVVEAGDEGDAIDEFCDSEHGHLIHADLSEEEFEEWEDFAGNDSRPVDLDDVMVHSLKDIEVTYRGTTKELFGY